MRIHSTGKMNYMDLQRIGSTDAVVPEIGRGGEWKRNSGIVAVGRGVVVAESQREYRRLWYKLLKKIFI